MSAGVFFVFGKTNFNLSQQWNLDEEVTKHNTLR